MYQSNRFIFPSHTPYFCVDDSSPSKTRIPSLHHTSAVSPSFLCLPSSKYSSKRHWWTPGVPIHLPPIPSAVAAGRARPREPSSLPPPTTRRSIFLKPASVLDRPITRSILTYLWFPNLYLHLYFRQKYVEMLLVLICLATIHLALCSPPATSP